ncbi:MAG TPA: PEGA domain-containing protein [Planctomycetota bacterium]|jgi:hypothetical protein
MNDFPTTSSPPASYAAQPEERSVPAWFWALLLLAVVGGLIWRERSGGGASTLSVDTTPVGASVLVNGHLAGGAPVSLSGLKPGTYSIRVEKEGYLPLIKQVAIGSREVRLKETLRRCGTGTLAISIKPRGAEILLDGELLGQTPLRRDVPVGLHELLIRKTNFKPYAQRIDVEAGQVATFKDFALEDVVLGMLRAAVERDKQRVSTYMDLGHYLFVNDELDESAEVYATAYQVAGQPLVFPEKADNEEKRLELRLRTEDLNRLNEEVRKKSHWPGKDTTKWAATLRRQQEVTAGTNITEWPMVFEQVQNFLRDNKDERAQSLLLAHINAAKNAAMLPQAYIQLLSVRLKMHNMPGLRETFATFNELYGGTPVLGRQAANAIYTAAAGFQGEPQKEVLGMAEKLLVRGVNETHKGRGEGELNALCRFELANVMALQGRGEQALPFYRESINGTADQSTRELRRQKLADCLIKIRNYMEARTELNILAKSPRTDIQTKAQEDLRLLDNKLREDLSPDTQR